MSEPTVKIHSQPSLQVLEYTNPEGYFGAVSSRAFGEIAASDLVKDRKKGFTAVARLLRAHRQFPEDAEILSISLGANRAGHELLVVVISTKVPVTQGSRCPDCGVAQGEFHTLDCPRRSRCPKANFVTGALCTRSEGHEGMHQGLHPLEGTHITWTDEQARPPRCDVTTQFGSYRCKLPKGHESEHEMEAE